MNLEFVVTMMVLVMMGLMVVAIVAIVHGQSATAGKAIDAIPKVASILPKLLGKEKNEGDVEETADNTREGS